MSYVQYPNLSDRIFSFEDILYFPIVIDYIGLIIDKYKDKRARSPEEWSRENPYFLNIDFNQIKRDISEIEWNDHLYYHIVASQHNLLSYPLLIEYKNKIIVSPTRLKLAREMMFERLIHNTISGYLSIIYENQFQKEVLDILNESDCIIIDPINNDYWIYISDKKRSTFEFDIMALFKKYILIIECKSFHPTAFYHLKDAVSRREERVEHFYEQYPKKIKHWIINNLKKKSKGEFIRINCRTKEIGSKKTKKFNINFPKEFNGIDENYIIGLYITQYKECFK